VGGKHADRENGQSMQPHNDQCDDAANIELDGVFLKPNAKIEFLASRWPAWPHLIPPIQHAMNIAFRYLPIMESFVANPKVHCAASADPKFIGGPFIDLPESAAPEIKDLVRQTKAECAELIAFARDYKQFDKTLQESARGYCLHNFYQTLPPTLAGLVELAYDVNNHPSIRVIEEISYAYGLENRFTQEVSLHDQPDSARKFFANTPRLSGPNTFFAKTQFANPALDQLSLMRIQRGSFRACADLFCVAPLEEAGFRKLFTTTPPVRNSANYDGSAVRIRYFGHACVLIQSCETNILIDPLVTWDADSDGRFTFSDLPDSIDFLIISHAHQDHFSPEMLVQLRPRVKKVIVPRNTKGNIADPSMALMLRRLGYTSIDTVDTFDVVQFGEGTITSLPFSGEHADLDISSKQTVLIELKGRKFFFLVDSDAIDPALYKVVVDLAGRLDAVFVGMECYGAPLSWLYGPLLTTTLSRRDDESRRLSASDCERAWRLMKDLDCSTAYIYAMGQEPWLRYIMGLEYQPGSIQLAQASNFIDRCRDSGVTVEHLHISREMLF
jgi:L-ascorbate metabolism protein UlaG (beta-lactamase superfamily)